jgi:hypothetical protein
MTISTLQEPTPTPQPAKRHDGGGSDVAIWVAFAVVIASTWGGQRCNWWRKKKDPAQPTA